MRLLGWLLIVVAVRGVVAAEDESEARKGLQGTWVGRVEDGATGHKLTIQQDRITGVKDEKQSLGEGRFQLDLKSRPWKLDATGTKGPQRGRKYLGICVLEGDTLKWCVSTPGNERPTELATKDGQFLLVLKRPKN
jgi:uncharacterized protein (TIGR03067 family)